MKMRLLKSIENEHAHLDSATMVAEPQLSKLGNCASVVQCNLTGHIDTSADFPTTQMSSIITIQPLTLVLIIYNTYYPIGELSLFSNH